MLDCNAIFQTKNAEFSGNTFPLKAEKASSSPLESIVSENYVSGNDTLELRMNKDKENSLHLEVMFTYLLLVKNHLLTLKQSLLLIVCFGKKPFEIKLTLFLKYILGL